MTVKHNNNILNLITGCLYVSSFGLHVSVNFMTIIRSIRSKIHDMKQSFPWNAMGSHWGFYIIQYNDYCIIKFKKFKI